MKAYNIMLCQNEIEGMRSFEVDGETIMESDLFRKKVQQIKAEKPILFALESDTPPPIDEIEHFEKMYSIALPEKYKLFISEFGGGYFGYANIYSLDNSSNYFIMKHKSFVPNSYLPIADNGCGDFYVVKCNGEYYSDRIYFYRHGSQEIIETTYHDIFEYLLDVGLKAL